MTTAAVLAVAALVVFTAGTLPSLIVVGIVVLAAAFGVRGYTVADGSLMVHRLGWATRIPLAGLESVEAESGATIGSARVFGIGGVFAFVGRYRNDILGTYRAYATDGMLAVVLYFGDEKIVVTPDAPLTFADAVRVEAGLEPEPD